MLLSVTALLTSDLVTCIYTHAAVVSMLSCSHPDWKIKSKSACHSVSKINPALVEQCVFCIEHKPSFHHFHEVS